MWNYKYVDIQNQELVVTNLPSVDVIPQVLVELAQMRESKFCYFNQSRWFDFLTYLLYKFGRNTKVNEKNQFYLYGSFWFDSFYVDVYDNIRPLNVSIQDDVFLNFHGHLLNRFVGQTCPDKLLTLYNFYYKVKKSAREVINSLFAHNNVATLYLLDKPLSKDDFVDLPKGWKDKLVQLDKLLFSNALVYFQDKTFKESFHVLNQLKFYTKKYGVLFQQLIDNQKLDLDDSDNVKHKFYTYLNKNNRLLCEPLRVSFTLLGNWKLVELNTTYDFVEESAVQNHCIGRSNSYTSRVRSGHIRAFSFRKNERRYTIVYARQGNVWYVEQGKCINNRDKEVMFSGSDLKYLEVNIERLKKELDKQLRRIAEDDLF
jgi:hypothetical protein